MSSGRPRARRVSAPRRKAPRSRGTPRLQEQVAELSALLELATALGSAQADDATLGAALGTVTRALGAAAGALYVKGADGVLTPRAAQSLPRGAPPSLAASAVPHALTFLEPGDVLRDQGFVLLCPIRRREEPIAVLGLGAREDGQPYGADAEAFLRCAAACLAAPLENASIHDELRRLTGTLSSKVFQLHDLFDIGRELAGTFDEQALPGRIVTAALGHFVVSRGALYLFGADGLALAHGQGLGAPADGAPIPGDEARAVLGRLVRPAAVGELPEGELRRRLRERRLALVAALGTGAQAQGALALGERASGLPFSEEDREFAHTLAALALAALENARLQRLRAEKQRQDRELQLAREIQRSLFPRGRPELTGFEVAADSRSCHEVGGDSYDWIPLEGGRLALVVADVSGKGTPASLLMASVHAYLQAIAGTAAPATVVERLNRFVFANTQANQYVTLFYAELDPVARRLTYVNAGHIPPFRLGADGAVARLQGGEGVAVGLLDGVAYEAGQAHLPPGETLVVVTDGVTEALAPDERELGDEGVAAVLSRVCGGTASEVLAALVTAVDDWTGHRRTRDDLTALVLRAR